MTEADLCAGAILITLCAYAVLGGADFGGGVLDLFARGKRASLQRAAIARAMGPVWETNHVWLIFALVATFTAFPTAFQVLGIALFLPLLIALIGIVARGVAFAFRGYFDRDVVAYNRFGTVFGVASVVTPFVLGAAAGGIASSPITFVDNKVTTDGIVAVWTTPFALVCGCLAVAMCAFLAATFLCVEMQKSDEPELSEDFRTRALITGAVAGVISIVAFVLAKSEAPHLYAGLTVEALPVVLVGVLCGGASFAANFTRRFGWARIISVLAVICVMAGWGIAQYPELIGPDVTVATASAPAITQQYFLGVFVFALAILAPAMYLLYVVFRRNPTKLER